MNAHALHVLEFSRAMDLVAERAATAAGARKVRHLLPVTDGDAIEREHAYVAAMRALVVSDAGWTPEPIPDLDGAPERLRVAGAALSAPQLLALQILLRSSRRTREELRAETRPKVPLATLRPFADRLAEERDVERAIERAIGDDATVRDSASALLRRVRRDLRAAQGEIVFMLERFMQRLGSTERVPDMSVTVRNGRYVIPIRRDARSAVGGIVHDTSASGATLFVEPPVAVDAGNRMRELEAEETREVERILLELTDLARPRRERILESLDALSDLDSLYARARYAVENRCAAVTLCAPADGFGIRGGRHPLLLAQGIAVVPFDLAMSPGERTLLVSGPNTGGKTVLLKAIGLLSAMSQAGVPIPVSAGSRLAVFDDVFADVGDEQSIEASLSTFSAHLRNLAEILRASNDRSLALIDELGSGTDPVEGAALGGAILEDLTRRGALTIATTHLGVLKDLAGEVSGVVNASLQFDTVALAPTYHLIKGIPGRSYGLSIAGRLNLPHDVLARAEERLPSGERDLSALLADLQAREAALREREHIAAEVTADARMRLTRLTDRERAVRQRERDLERASRREARRYLLDARAEVERTIRELRDAGSDAVDEVGRAARRQVEGMAAEHGEALERLERSESEPKDAAQPTPLVAGDWVELATLRGQRGRLLEVRDGDGVVAVGAVKLTVPLATLTRGVRQAVTPETVVTITGDVPEVHAPSEIDVRGLRVSEVDDRVMQALDSAIRADLKAFRIIHGKGTGALRDRVAEMLRKDTRVRAFRLGAWNEGGAGVTVAEL